NLFYPNLDPAAANPFRLCFQHKSPGLFSCLHQGCELAAEELHPGKLERLQAGRISIGDRLESAGTLHREADLPVIRGTEIASLVHELHIHEGNILTVAIDLAAIGLQHNTVRLSGSMY